MNNLQIFDNAEFGQIRTVTIDNEPWFVAKDVCEALKHTNPTMAIQMLEEDERTKLSLGRAGETNVINESGLYTLIIKSNLPNAKKFRKWVTSEVLPSIRKTGSYQKPLTAIEQLQLTQQAVLEVKEQIDSIDKDLQDFKKDLPLLAVECEKITKAVKTKGVEVLGGRNSEAYKDNSIRNKVYSDIYREIKRQFGVESYKALKRNQCDTVIGIVNNYHVPMIISEEIKNANSQMRIEDEFMKER